MHMPKSRQTGVSVREAAIRFGTSESDIRRRIKRGELVAESIARPGGTLLRVLLDDATDAPGAMSANALTPSVAPTPEPLQDAPVLTVQLLAIVAADRETILAQVEKIAELRERVGRAEAASEAASTHANTLQAEIERAASTIVTLNAALEARTAAESTPAPAGPSTPLGRFLGLWRWLVLVLVVAVTTMVTLLAWPQ